MGNVGGEISVERYILGFSNPKNNNLFFLICHETFIIIFDNHNHFFIIIYETAKQIAQKINLELMCGYLWLFLTRSWSYAWMWIISAKSHWTILCFNFCSNRERIKTSKLRIWLSYALKKYLLIEKHLVILILLHGALQWLIAKKDQFQFQR